MTRFEIRAGVLKSCMGGRPVAAPQRHVADKKLSLIGEQGRFDDTNETQRTGRAVEELAEFVIMRICVDPREALCVAGTAALIAQQLSQTDAGALALRTKADALYAR